MDTFSKEERSEIMRKVGGKDTRPEMIVRRLIHRMGYRYRLHQKELPGNPDLVFRSTKKVVFVHGCFWHQHSECKRAALPKSNREYWDKKLKGNKARDAKNLKKLKSLNWKCLVVWECEISDLYRIEKRLRRFLEA